MKKKNGKFNIVDLIVITVIVLACGYAIYALIISMGEGGASADIRYVIETDEIRHEVAANIAEGDEVYSEDGTYIGRVASFEVAPAKLTGTDSSGNVVVSETEDYIIYLTVDVSAASKKTGYMVDDVLIAAGERYSIRTKGMYLSGECVSVKIADN